MSSQPENERKQADIQARREAQVREIERAEIIPVSYAWRNPYPHDLPPKGNGQHS